MAKKFMYVCLGILALAVAFHLGAQYGRADYIDHSASGIVAAFNGGVANPKVLLENGEIWSFVSLPPYWEQDNDLHGSIVVPLPVSQIKFIDSNQLCFDLNDNAWLRTQDGWVNCGPPPGYSSTHPTTSRISR